MQLLLPIKAKLYYTKDNWIISEHNQDATNLILSSKQNVWLCGEKGSGKTHLATIWKDQNNAFFFNETIDYHSIKFNTKLVLDDVDKYKDEEFLFHFFNHIIEKKTFVLFTSRHSPNRLNIKLKDLSSRVKTIPLVYLYNPNDQDLTNILTIKLKKKGILINKTFSNFILNRTERTIKAINKWIDKIEQKSSKISISVLKDIEKELNL